MQTRTQDRRQSDRVTFWSPVVLEAPDGAEPAALRNLSVAGLSCTTSRPFTEMTQLKLTLDLPATKEGESPLRLELQGAVVRCRPLRHATGKRRFDVALYFLDLTDAARQALTELVRTRLGA